MINLNLIYVLITDYRLHITITDLFIDLEKLLLVLVFFFLAKCKVEFGRDFGIYPFLPFRM